MNQNTQHVRTSVLYIGLTMGFIMGMALAALIFVLS
jgi:hypothetical protein